MDNQPIQLLPFQFISLQLSHIQQQESAIEPSIVLMNVLGVVDSISTVSFEGDLYVFVKGCDAVGPLNELKQTGSVVNVFKLETSSLQLSFLSRFTLDEKLSCAEFLLERHTALSITILGITFTGCFQVLRVNVNQQEDSNFSKSATLVCSTVKFKFGDFFSFDVYKTERETTKIQRMNVIILDDYGLQSLDKEARSILMDIIEDRHEQKSTIITSQLPVAAWYDIIGKTSHTDAIMDR